MTFLQVAGFWTINNKSDFGDNMDLNLDPETFLTLFNIVKYGISRRCKLTFM